MSTNKIEISEVEKLLAETDWSITKIAAHLGITRQAVYERLHREGIKIERRRKKSLQPTIDRETLTRLYLVEKLSVARVADELGVPEDKVDRNLRLHNIPRRSAQDYLRRYPEISEMAVGDSFEIALTDQKMKTFSSLHKQAKQIGHRIVIRRKDDDTAVVTRTRVLSPEAVSVMYESGMTRAAIATVFLCTRDTITKILRTRE